MKECSFAVKLKAVCYICAALGWWGVLYPELAMTCDTYRVVGEESAQTETFEIVEKVHSENFPQNTTYWQILEAGPEEIQFRSKLLEKLGLYTANEE